MDQEPPAKSAKSWVLPLIGLGVFLLAFVSVFWYYQEKKSVWTNDAYLDGYQIAISADIEARITELFVDEGDTVVKNQLLCQLDESIFLSRRADAATHVLLLEETVKRQKIEMEKLYDIYVVAKQEYENQIISYIDFDKIEKNYLYAAANYRVSEADLTNGIAKLGVIDELLQHTRIYAPRDGSISKRWVVAGDVANVGQPLFNLTDTKNIWVTANLEETKVGHLRAGDPVTIHIDAYPHREFSGSVLVVRASAASQFSLIPPDNATGNFTKVVQRVPIKILLDIPKGQNSLYLYPGMSAEVSIQIR